MLLPTERQIGSKKHRTHVDFQMASVFFLVVVVVVVVVVGETPFE